MYTKVDKLHVSEHVAQLKSVILILSLVVSFLIMNQKVYL